MRIVGFVLCILVSLSTSPAQAQYSYGNSTGFGPGGFGPTSRVGPTNRPTFSPYLNLLRRGNSTLGNYYGLVRPELEFRRADSQFQANFGSLDRRFSDVQRDLSGRQMQTTGHRVQFLSNLRGSSGGASSSRAARIGRDGRPLPGFGPTGHTAVFGNNGAWYSGRPLSGPQRR